VLGPSGFEEGTGIGRSNQISSQIYQRRIDGIMTVVKVISLSGLIAQCQIENELENLLNLRHPIIAPLIDWLFLVKSSGRREFKSAGL
jgi:hypothetical protein